MEGAIDTAEVMEMVTKMWNIFSVKSKTAGRSLKDPNKVYTSKWSSNILDISGNTANALHITLHRLTSIVPVLLAENVKCVFLGQFSSDHIEREFGLYKRPNGGNYLISIMQVLNILVLQWLHLLCSLDMEKSVHENSDWCKKLLMMKCLVNEKLWKCNFCFENAFNLKEHDHSAHY